MQFTFTGLFLSSSSLLPMPLFKISDISASIVNVNGLWIENKAIQTKKFNSSSSTKKGFPDKCNVSATLLLS